VFRCLDKFKESVSFDQIGSLKSEPHELHGQLNDSANCHNFDLLSNKILEIIQAKERIYQLGGGILRINLETKQDINVTNEV